MKNKSAKNWINGIFLGVLACLLLAGLVRTLFLPNEINEYENRYAERVKPLTFSSYVNSEFQDSIELALGDQIPGAEKMKETYNGVFSAYSSGLLRQIFHLGKPQDVAAGNDDSGTSKTEPDQNTAEVSLPPDEQNAHGEGSVSESGESGDSAEMTDRNPEDASRDTQENAGTIPEGRQAEDEKEQNEPVQDNRVFLSDTDPENWPDIYILIYGYTWLYRNHLIYPQQRLDAVRGVVDGWLGYVKEAVDRNPNTTFYGYYIEKDSDMNFATEEMSRVSEYILDRVAIPRERMGVFPIRSFRDYDAFFYKTDHHWNADGSYKGYREILSMLLPGETPINSLGRVEIGVMKGSKQVGDAAIYTEMLRVNEYSFPELSVRANGYSGVYGRQEYYVNRAKGGQQSNNVTYGQFYGQDNGETIFHNAASTNGSILVIGESFDNAILKLLASHFTDLYSIDLRNYEAQLGRPFDITTYLAENNIDRVLLVGGMEYWYGRTPLCTNEMVQEPAAEQEPVTETAEQEAKDGLQ